MGQGAHTNPGSIQEGESQSPKSTQLVSLVETAVTQAAMFAAIVAGTVGLLYVIGGTVMWLRFDRADLPADRAVALVPKTDLLVLGLRVMVLPALASAALLLTLGSIWRGRQANLQRLRKEKREHERRLKEPSNEGEELRERVDRLDEEIRRTDVPPVMDHLPTPRGNPVRFALLAGLALLVGLVVPFSVGALAWPVALVGLLWYWLRLTSEQRAAGATGLPVWRLSLAAALAASIITVARQTDPPVDLVSVRAEIVNPPGLLKGVLGDAPVRREQGRRLVAVSGILVSVSDDTLNIGNAEKRVIASIPRTRVTSLMIGPPLDQRAPPRSLLSRLISGDAWAVTPLEMWCVNVKYNWGHIWDACEAHPVLVSDGTLSISDDRVRGLSVKCPPEADRECRGFVILVTHRLGANPLGPEGAPCAVVFRRIRLRAQP